MARSDFLKHDSTYVIAEIGNNHEGDFDLANTMIGLAAEAGVDAVKFQSIEPTELVAKDQVERIKQLARFRFEPAQFGELAERAADYGVDFLSTPFHLSAVEYLCDLVPAYKIASGDLDHVPLLRAVAETGKPVILSTGMADTDLIEKAVGWIRDVWSANGLNPTLTLMQCTVSYPTIDDDANLAAMKYLASIADHVGYSDHTLGIDAAVLSVALGARVIEKHFTIDRHFSDFRDHQLSADPDDMREMIGRIRRAEKLMGDGKKRIIDSEDPNHVLRRRLFATRTLPAGHVLKSDDVIALRSTNGISVEHYDQVVGECLTKPVETGQVLDEDCLGIRP